MASQNNDSHSSPAHDPSIPPSDKSCPFDTVPHHLLSEIISYLPTKKDCRELMLTWKRFIEPARKVHWRYCNVNEYKKLLNLDDLPDHGYAGMVRSLELALRPSDADPFTPRPPLPLLEHLSIKHDWPHSQDHHIDVSRFITARLRTFNIEGGKIDNFLHAMAQAKCLTKLLIHEDVEVEDGNASLFLDLIHSLPHLTQVSAGCLSSPQLFVELARRANIKQVGFHSLTRITIDDTVTAMQTLGAFARLETLSISMQASAAALLLPSLQRLTSLKLYICADHLGVTNYGCTVPDIIKALCEKKLEVLHLEFQSAIHMVILAENLAPLKTLTALKHFHLWHSFWGMHYLALDDYLPTSPLMKSLSLACAHHSFDAEALVLVGSRFPRLQKLTISGHFHLDKISDISDGPLFPALQRMQLSTALQLTKENADDAVKALAAKLYEIAPALQNFNSDVRIHPGFAIEFLRRYGIVRCIGTHQWERYLIFNVGD